MQKEKTGQTQDRGAAGRIDPAALALLTAQVRNLLAFHQEMGLSAYPAAPELRQFLSRSQSRVQGRQRQAPSFSGAQRKEEASLHGPARQQERRQEREQFEKPVRPQSGPPTAETVREQLRILHQEVAQCRQCSSGTAARPVAGQGNPRPRLLVLGDCFLGTSRAKGLIWGKEEDAMLWRMMQAIGLDRDAVYVTNALKCPQPVPVQAGSPTEQSCFSHVVKEVQIIRPPLICAMGDTATRALLNSKAPLVRLRGKFHTYKYPQGGTAKVMATFHPRLLLQHPEMKQATWRDLQAVQRLLLTFPPAP